MLTHSCECCVYVACMKMNAHTGRASASAPAEVLVKHQRQYEPLSLSKVIAMFDGSTWRQMKTQFGFFFFSFYSKLLLLSSLPYHRFDSPEISQVGEYQLLFWSVFARCRMEVVHIDRLRVVLLLLLLIVIYYSSSLRNHQLAQLRWWIFNGAGRSVSLPSSQRFIINSFLFPIVVK